MDIKSLEAIMIKNGLAIRAIPQTITKLYIGSLIEKTPKNAGKFVIEQVKNSSNTIQFFPKNNCYDTIEEAVKGLLGLEDIVDENY